MSKEKKPVTKPAVAKAPEAVETVAVAPVVEAPVEAVVAVAPAPAKAASKKPVAKPEFDLMKPFTAVQEQMRAQAEKGAEQMRANYAIVKGNAETATVKLEQSMIAARTGAKAFGDKLIEVVQAETKAHLDHVQKLGAARSLDEVAKLQHAFMLAQLDTYRTRSTDLTAFSQKIANDIAEPAKASLVAAWKR
jgi:phasin